MDVSPSCRDFLVDGDVVSPQNEDVYSGPFLCILSYINFPSYCPLQTLTDVNIKHALGLERVRSRRERHWFELSETGKWQIDDRYEWHNCRSFLDSMQNGLLIVQEIGSISRFSSLWKFRSPLEPRGDRVQTANCETSCTILSDNFSYCICVGFI